MGTNYYAKVHLGKHSFDREPAGTFFWATVIEDKAGRPNMVIESIEDEYGDPVTLAEFEALVARWHQTFSYVGQEFS